MVRLFVAFLSLLWPLAVATGQTAPAEASQPNYTYAAPLGPAADAYDHVERGPPLAGVTTDASTDQRAVDAGSRGVSARPQASATAVTHTYDGTTRLVQVADGADADTEVGDVSRADLSSFQLGFVAAKTADHVQPIGPGSEKAWSVLNRVDAKGAPLNGYKGGGVFENSKGGLPQTPGVTFRKWDVNPNIKGVDRGAERLVTGSDGSAYWTGDHYKSFLMFRGPTG